MSSKQQEVKQELQRKTADMMRVASDEIDAFGDALRKGSESLDDSRLTKTMLRSAADAVDGVADAADGKSIADATHDLSEFARRRPLAVYGVAAILGFAFARYAAARPVEDADDLSPYEDYADGPAYEGVTPSTNGAHAPMTNGALS